MAHEEALAAVNALQDGLAGLARTVATALKDGKISPMEGFALGMKGMTFASTVALIMQSGNRDDILYVLEHGDWVLEENPMLGAPGSPGGK